MKKILLVEAHTESERHTCSLANAHQRGAIENGHSVSIIRIRDLEFEPNLKFGYDQRIDLEPDLLSAEYLDQNTSNDAYVETAYRAFLAETLT